MEIGTLGDGTVIKIKLGFLLICLGSLGGMLGTFFLMRQDILDTLKRVEKLEQLRSADFQEMNNLKIKVNQIDTNLYYFREEYNTDADKYLREPKDRRR